MGKVKGWNDSAISETGDVYYIKKHHKVECGRFAALHFIDDCIGKHML